MSTFQIKDLTDSLQKLAIQCYSFFFNSFLIFLLWWDISSWNVVFNLASSLQIRPRKYSAQKYVWHHFGKGKRLWWDSKQNGWLSKQKQPFEGVLQKRCSEIFPKIHKKTSVWESLFDKVRCCRFTTSFKMNFAKFVSKL